MIPYGRQDIRQEDIARVVEVLQSDYLTQGPAVPQFESALADYCDARHAVAVNSATSALHIACSALELGPGDWLWTSPITFVASANCGVYCGASVDFVDIDPLTYNMSPAALRAKLEKAKAQERLPKVVVVVHLCGQPCDMLAIGMLAEEYGFRIIEDASHAVGARYQDESVGNCRHSDITVFSFHPVKIITSAEGGIALTNHAELSQRMQLARSHGVTREPELMTQTDAPPWYYEQISLGFNYRMTDIQAALGMSQMARLDDYLLKRHELAKHYNHAFAELPLRLPYQSPESYSAFHLYVIRLQLDHLSIDHKSIFVALREAGLGVNLHYIPVHTQPFYQRQGVEYDPLPEALAYYREAISLPMFPTLSTGDQEAVVDIVTNVIGQAASG